MIDINRSSCHAVKQYLQGLIILVALLFSGCASFQKGMENPSPLTKSNLIALNGKYSINASNEEARTKNYWMYNNFLQELDRKLLADTFKIDSTKLYAIELTVLDNQRLKLNYLENGKSIRERILNTRLKKDGYLYLKNKNIGFVLVPYIAGAIDIKKTRLSKTESGELLFDVANHRSGAFMVIVFLDGRTWKYRKIYPKVI